MKRGEYLIGDTVRLLCDCHKGRLATVVAGGSIPMVNVDNGKPEDQGLPCLARELELVTTQTREKLAGHPRFYELSDEERTLHGEKNADYAKGGNPLGNFVRVSAIKRLYPTMDWSSPTGVTLGYMLKQLDCALWMKSGNYEGKVEGFKSRMMDVSVYSKLAIINNEEE